MIRRTGCFVTVAFLLWTFFSSCSPRPPVPTVTVLGVMRSEWESGASGILRTRSVAPDDPAHLTDALLSVLYGESARGWLTAHEGEVPLINDAALWLSVGKHPYELAVFRCSDARGTATAAAICRARLDSVRRAWQGDEWSDVLERAIVAVEQEYVLLIIAPDSEALLRIARRAIRS